MISAEHCSRCIEYLLQDGLDEKTYESAASYVHKSLQFEFTEEDVEKKPEKCLFRDRNTAELLTTALLKHMNKCDSTYIETVTCALSIICQHLLKKLKKETISLIVIECLSLIEKALQGKKLSILTQCTSCLILIDTEEYSQILTGQRPRILNFINSCICLRREGDTDQVVRLQCVALELFLKLSKNDIITRPDDWFLKLIPLLFDEDAVLRKLARASFEIVQSHNPLYSLCASTYWSPLKESITHLYSKILIKFAQSSQPDWGDLWCLMIHVLGNELCNKHNCHLVNKLLAVQEAAFKSSSMSIRMEAFKCWKFLVNKFLETARDEAGRKLKLLIQPLMTSSTKTPEIYSIKFDIWWDLIHGFHSGMETPLLNVLPKFLSFCFGPLGNNTLVFIDTSGGSGGNAVPGCAIPRKKYLDVVKRADALAQILMLDFGESQENFKLRRIQSPLLAQPRLFVSISKELIHSAAHCTVNLFSGKACSPKDRKFYLEKIWRNLLRHIHRVPFNGLDEKHVEVMKDFFRALTALNTLAAVNESVAVHCFLPILEMLLIGDLSLPTEVLWSRAYYVGTEDLMAGTAIFVILDIMFSQAFLTLKERSNMQYMFLVEHFFSSAIGRFPETLSVTQSVLKRMGSMLSGSANSEVGASVESIWICLARKLISNYLHLGRNINQGDADEPDFKCMFTMLLFPIVHSETFHHEQQDNTYKVWGHLYEAFQKNVLEGEYGVEGTMMCSALCQKTMKALNCQKVQSMEQLLHVITLIASAVEIIPAKTLSEDNSTDSSVTLLDPCFQIMLYPIEQLRKLDVVQEIHLKIMEHIATCYNVLLQKVPMTILLRHMVTYNQGEVHFLLSVRVQNELSESRAYDLFAGRLIALWQSFLNFMGGVLEVYKKSEREYPDPARLFLNPLLKAGSTHPVSEVRDISKKFIDTFVPSRNSSADKVTSMSSSPMKKLSDKCPAGTQLRDKSPMGSKLRDKSPMGTTGKQFRKPKPGGLKASLKNRPLTEHQIEKLKERRDDIPALYMDLTQDSQDLTTQSFEDSSQSQSNSSEPAKTDSKEERTTFTAALKDPEKVEITSFSAVLKSSPQDRKRDLAAGPSPKPANVNQTTVQSDTEHGKKRPDKYPSAQGKPAVVTSSTAVNSPCSLQEKTNSPKSTMNLLTSSKPKMEKTSATPVEFNDKLTSLFKKEPKGYPSKKKIILPVLESLSKGGLVQAPERSEEQVCDSSVSSMIQKKPTVSVTTHMSKADSSDFNVTSSSCSVSSTCEPLSKTCPDDVLVKEVDNKGAQRKSENCNSGDGKVPVKTCTSEVKMNKSDHGIRKRVGYVTEIKCKDDTSFSQSEMLEKKDSDSVAGKSGRGSKTEVIEVDGDAKDITLDADLKSCKSLINGTEQTPSSSHLDINVNTPNGKIVISPSRVVVKRLDDEDVNTSVCRALTFDNTSEVNGDDSSVQKEHSAISGEEGKEVSRKRRRRGKDLRSSSVERDVVENKVLDAEPQKSSFQKENLEKRVFVSSAEPMEVEIVLQSEGINCLDSNKKSEDCLKEKNVSIPKRKTSHDRVTKENGSNLVESQTPEISHQVRENNSTIQDFHKNVSEVGITKPDRVRTRSSSLSSSESSKSESPHTSRRSASGVAMANQVPVSGKALRSNPYVTHTALKDISPKKPKIRRSKEKSETAVPVESPVKAQTPEKVCKSPKTKQHSLDSWLVKNSPNKGEEMKDEKYVHSQQVDGGRSEVPSSHTESSEKSSAAQEELLRNLALKPQTASSDSFHSEIPEDKLSDEDFIAPTPETVCSPKRPKLCLTRSGKTEDVESSSQENQFDRTGQGSAERKFEKYRGRNIEEALADKSFDSSGGLKYKSNTTTKRINVDAENKSCMEVLENGETEISPSYDTGVDHGTMVTGTGVDHGTMVEAECEEVSGNSSVPLEDRIEESYRIFDHCPSPCFFGAGKMKSAIGNVRKRAKKRKLMDMENWNENRSKLLKMSDGSLVESNSLSSDVSASEVLSEDTNNSMPLSLRSPKSKPTKSSPVLNCDSRVNKILNDSKEEDMKKSPVKSSLLASSLSFLSPSKAPAKAKSLMRALGGRKYSPHREGRAADLLGLALGRERGYAANEQPPPGDTDSAMSEEGEEEVQKPVPNIVLSFGSNGQEESSPWLKHNPDLNATPSRASLKKTLPTEETPPTASSSKKSVRFVDPEVTMKLFFDQGIVKKKKKRPRNNKYRFVRTKKGKIYFLKAGLGTAKDLRSVPGLRSSSVAVTSHGGAENVAESEMGNLTLPVMESEECLGENAVENTTETLVVSSAEIAADSTAKITTDSTAKIATDSTVKMATDSTVKMATDSTVKMATDSTAKIATDSTAKMATDSTAKMATDSTVKMATDSTAKMATDSTAKMATDSTVKMATDSTAKMATDSTAKMATDSTAKMATDSTAKMATDSTAKMATDSTAKMATDSTAKMATDSTAKMATDSTAKMATDSTAKMATDSTAKMATDSTAKMATDSTAKMATDSTAKMATDSTAKMATDSTAKMATDSTAKMATDSTAKMATDSTAKMATDSTAKMATDSTAKMATDSTAKMATDSTAKIVTDITTKTPVDSTTRTPADSTAKIPEMPADSAAENSMEITVEGDDVNTVGNTMASVIVCMKDSAVGNMGENAVERTAKGSEKSKKEKAVESKQVEWVISKHVLRRKQQLPEKNKKRNCREEKSLRYKIELKQKKEDSVKSRRGTRKKEEDLKNTRNFAGRKEQDSEKNLRVKGMKEKELVKSKRGVRKEKEDSVKSEGENATQTTPGSDSENSSSRLRNMNSAPVYPPLMRCNSSILGIVGKLAMDSGGKKTLLEAFNKLNISTIGELSSLSEKEVSKLPIKDPKWQTLEWALSDFEFMLKNLKMDKEGGVDVVWCDGMSDAALESYCMSDPHAVLQVLKQASEALPAETRLCVNNSIAHPRVRSSHKKVQTDPEASEDMGNEKSVLIRKHLNIALQLSSENSEEGSALSDMVQYFHKEVSNKVSPLQLASSALSCISNSENPSPDSEVNAALEVLLKHASPSQAFWNTIVKCSLAKSPGNSSSEMVKHFVSALGNNMDRDEFVKACVRSMNDLL